MTKTATPKTAKPRSKAAPKLAMSASRDIPFDKLEISAANVRHVKAGVSIEELAEDIARRTLLTALTVRPVLDDAGAETGRYGVLAGGRRTRALQLLVSQKRLPKNAPIPCIVRTEGIAEADSLAENVQRAPLHPLDQFRAFRTLREKGQSEEEIAAAFFVSPSVVKQRLKLAAVAPALLDAYADDAMTLDALMAFTVNPDHARQIQVWEAISRGPVRQPYEIRRMLTEGAVRASDRRAMFVGLEAYEAAGGTVLRDLFQADDGGWLQDTGLLERIVSEKLTAEADAVRAEGWRWVEVATDFPYGHAFGLRRIHGEPASLSDEEQAQLDALRAEHAALEEQHGDADELPEEVDRRLGEIEADTDALEHRPPTFADEERAIAGAFVSIDASGGLRVERGFVRPEDEPKVQVEPEVTEATDADDDPHPVASTEPAGGDPIPEHDPEDDLSPLPDRLLVDLTTHRTLALRDALSGDPDTAILAALHAMVLQQFYRDGRGSCLDIDGDGVPIGHRTRGLTDTPYARSIETRREEWMRALPSHASELWDALVELDRDSREGLFAHCVAMTLNAVHDPYVRRTDAIAHANVLAERLRLDMAAAGWAPTADTYLGYITKARILEAVREAKGEAAAERIAGLKKPEMIVAAEELLAGSGWLPAPLRTPTLDSDSEKASPEPDSAPADAAAGEAGDDAEALGPEQPAAIAAE